MAILRLKHFHLPLPLSSILLLLQILTLSLLPLNEPPRIKNVLEKNRSFNGVYRKKIDDENKIFRP